MTLISDSDILCFDFGTVSCRQQTIDLFRFSLKIRELHKIAQNMKIASLVLMYASILIRF